jgi:branched-chain amino acid transport system permease protein
VSGTVAGRIGIERWTALSRAAVVAAGLVVAGLAAGPLFMGANAVDQLTTLFIYVILGAMWNAMAGYAGLVSVGQQAFFGLGAYFVVRLSDAGVPVYPALGLAALCVAVLAWPLSLILLRLRAGEFAIGMWVVAELAHLLVNLDRLVQGETGTSLIALASYPTEARRAATYWSALGAASVLLAVLFVLLRSRVGMAIRSIRDNEDAAASLGVRVLATKRLIFILAAFGAGLAGALWLATALSFQPKAYFSVTWTAYMIFMVLVGGLGTFEGPIIGAVLFFAIEAWFGDAGVWYLVGLGATALVFSLYLPRGIWGWMEDRTGVRLLFVGHHVALPGRRGGDR